MDPLAQETDTAVCREFAYVKKFVCDGKVCNAMCCRGWQAQLDAAAYERFCSLPSDEREELLSNLEWNEEAGVYLFKGQDKEGCPYLRGDLLCGLQKRYGLKMLSGVCAEYPRRTIRFPGIYARALCLSCPVAAELALFDKDALQITTGEFDVCRPAYIVAADDKEAIDCVNFFALQKTGVDILGRHDQPLTGRLAALGDFLIEAQKLIDQNDPAAICDLSEKYAVPAAYAIKTDIGDRERQTEMSRELLKYTAKILDDDSADTAKFIERLAEIPSASLAAEGEKNRRRHALPLANYLINEYFATLYPCAVPGTIEENCRVFMAVFALLELHLAVTSLKKDLKREDIVGAVMWTARHTNHYVGFLSAVTEFVKEKNSLFS